LTFEFVLAASKAAMSSSSSNVVGVHYRVGKKIGEGSFGVIFEGTNLLNNQQVAIKFVSGADLGR
jgi:serine/threonine protein kinase